MRTLFLCFTLLLCTCVRAQTTDSRWTAADAENYIRARNDSNTWDKQRFADDLANSRDTAWTNGLPTALYNLPAPVPAYDWGYANMRVMQLAVADRTILGATYTYAHDRYRPAAAGDSLSYYGNYFNIFILTDTVGENTRALMINSRNAPHYLGTGKQLTSVGPVEFAQMSLASGENFALVSQRYFDLRHGRTVLVAPFADGSVRFLQLADAPGSLRAGVGSDEWNAGEIEAFQRRLEADARVVAFFTQPGTLE